MIRFLLILLATEALFSCGHKQKKTLAEEVPGYWLVLYPQHQLHTKQQRKLYATVQDSIVSLLGLKTIQFGSAGIFRQTDSLFGRLGRWIVSAGNQLLIDDAGKGLEKFTGQLLSVENDTMQVAEHITVQNQQIQIVWHLKRITGKERLFLFEEQANWWRKKPVSTEDETQLKKRVRAMLEYYSLYYKMVSKESIYFLQSRVFLPFRYYQHSMGLKPFEDEAPFNTFFYNLANAKRAHNIIALAMRDSDSKPFPSGENFVVEYGAYMKKLAGVIR